MQIFTEKWKSTRACSVTFHFVKFVMVRILADGIVTCVSIRHEYNKHDAWMKLLSCRLQWASKQLRKLDTCNNNLNIARPTDSFFLLDCYGSSFLWHIHILHVLFKDYVNLFWIISSPNFVELQLICSFNSLGSI